MSFIDFFCSLSLALQTIFNLINNLGSTRCIYIASIEILLRLLRDRLDGVLITQYVIDVYTFARIDAIDQVSGTTYITTKNEELISFSVFLSPSLSLSPFLSFSYTTVCVMVYIYIEIISCVHIAFLSLFICFYGYLSKCQFSFIINSSTKSIQFSFFDCDKSRKII